MEKENWIESIFNSTHGSIKASPQTDLFLNIQQRLKSQETVSPKLIWLAAASLTLLFLLNAKVIFGERKSSKPSVENLAASIISSNQLY